jgi:hypothetical protein
MGCYLEDYRDRVGIWAGRLSRRAGPRRSDANQATGGCLELGLTVLSSKVLAILLVTGGVEQNPSPSVEGENAIQLVCTGCGRNLKSGIQCELCGSLYNYSCRNVKVQMAEREKWNCEKCKTERFLKL